MIALLILVIEKFKNIKSYIPIFAVLFAICAWGTFGFFKTGRFPFMLSTITINPVVMSDVVMNKEFRKFYPKKSVDLIPKQFFMPKNIINEWDAYDYYKKKNSEFLTKNYDDYILQIPIKIKFILFNIVKDGVFPDNLGNYNNPIVISYVFNKIFLNLALILSSLTIFINWRIILFAKKGFLNFKNDIYYFSLFILNVIPHIIGWATSKHLVGITIASMIYLFLKFFEPKK
jgi:hypothetical protein